jgi:hypothetical protein
MLEMTVKHWAVETMQALLDDPNGFDEGGPQNSRIQRARNAVHYA